MLIRIPIDQISRMSRVTQGVRLITLKNNQKVTTVFNVNREEQSEDISRNEQTDRENA
jgi:DNA gyrase subunit A